MQGVKMFLIKLLKFNMLRKIKLKREGLLLDYYINLDIYINHDMIIFFI